MTRRADFRINLEAALKLALVEVAERAVGSEVQFLRLLVECLRSERRRRALEVAGGVADQRDEQDPREDDPDKECDYTDHLSSRPLFSSDDGRAAALLCLSGRR